MKMFVAALAAAFAVISTVCVAGDSVFFNPLQVDNQEIAQNGTYCFQRIRLQTGTSAAALTDLTVEADGSFPRAIRRVYLIDEASGKIVGSSTMLWDVQKLDQITMQVKDTVLSGRVYGLYAYIQGNYGSLNGTVSVHHSGSGYRSEQSANYEVGNSATHTLTYDYGSGVYIEPTDDIDLVAKVGVVDCFGAITVTGWGNPIGNCIELSLDVEHGSAADLRAIVLTDITGKRMGGITRIMSEDKKRMKAIIINLPSVSWEGQRTYLLRSTAGKSLNGAKVAFSLNPDGVRATGAQGERVAVNNGSDDIEPLQTIQVGKRPEYFDDYYYNGPWVDYGSVGYYGGGKGAVKE